jgi:hypothetical protein
MTVISTEFRATAVRNFLDEISQNSYYLFASEALTPPITNTEVLKKNFLEKTIFGKKINPDEVLYMILNHRWESGAVYNQYDDTKLLCGSKFYSVVFPENNETGDYRIYKCLFNSYGAESINPPNYNVNTPNQIYIMPDGYVWKFMYALSVVDFEKYNAQGFIPIPQNLINANNSIENGELFSNRSIDQIFVENPDDNIGYVSISGEISGINRTTGNITIKSDSTLSEIENFFSGYSFYVTSSTGSNVYEIVSYVYNQANDTASITLTEGAPIDTVLEPFSTFSIVPRVDVFGDGSNVIAIPNVSLSGSITKITVFNSGSGYSSAVASIRDPLGFDPLQPALYKRAVIRPILSPRGGHGHHLSSELSCRHILVYSDLGVADNNIIPTENSFSSIGLVKNPSFKTQEAPNVFDNRIEIALDTHNLIVGDSVSQIETSDTNSDFFNKVRFNARVHATNGNFIYLTDYNGAFPRDVDDSLPVYDGNDFSDISLRIDLPLLSSRGDILNINTDNDPEYPEGYDQNYPGFSLSPYVQRTGEVHYANGFSPITRTENSREQFKIILEF